MRTKIIRTFHPVGQGAFYSERINGFNFVYDCGTLSGIDKLKKIVTQSFSKKDTIDMLVISHFDEDHVNMIPILKDSVKEIKNVLFPLMSDVQKAYILSLYSDASLYNIILNPKAYFKEANIIYVSPEYIDNDNPPTDFRELGSQIPSGTKIGIVGNEDWIYIPYNNDNEEKSRMIKSAFDEKVKTDDNFRINIYDKDDLIDKLRNKKTRTKIRKLYESVGGTNDNSLLIYSGPISRKSHRISRIFRECECSYPCCCHSSNYAGCIYTGDATINEDVLPWIKKIKKSYDVGTIQIPHHGSANSFAYELLLSGRFYCVISVGRINRNRHPSNKVLEDILLANMIPILVTEASHTFFMEYIVSRGWI